MTRIDDGLAFMLKYENVAWYQDGVVKILDRRVYPHEVKYVVCRDYREVAQAIADTVTQSGGPWLAVQQAMVMTAYQVQDQPVEQAKAILREAAASLTRARPTTSKRMAAIVKKVLDHAESALDRGEAVGPSTMKGVKGYYPAFDITPPKLVSAMVTERGVFSPYDLNSFALKSNPADVSS